jgi:hypothetical protein
LNFAPKSKCDISVDILHYVIFNEMVYLYGEKYKKCKNDEVVNSSFFNPISSFKFQKENTFFRKYKNGAPLLHQMDEKSILKLGQKFFQILLWVGRVMGTIELLTDFKVETESYDNAH